MKFTDAGIRSLKPKEKRYIEWADKWPGFGVRVSPQGRKTWVYMYRHEGKNRMMSLGVYPAMSLADARKEYGKAQDDVERGKDPAAKLVNAKSADRNAMTVKELADEYMERWAKPQKKSWKNDEQILNLDVLPAWGRKKAKSIKRRDVIKLLDDIVHRGAPSQANHTHSMLSRMFNFAVERDILDSSPCYRVKKPAPTNTKERALSEREIKNLWEGFELESNTMGEILKLAIKGILITGQRPAEICSMELSELDENKEWWTLPGSKTKNSRQHRVPITRMMRNVIEAAIEARPEKAANSPYVFSSLRKFGRPITRDALSRSFRENLESFKLDDSPATPHDLRRTFTTEGGRIGIPREDRKRVLNHLDSDVTAIYDRYEYDKEKRVALEKWARHLEKITQGQEDDKIIPIRG